MRAAVVEDDIAYREILCGYIEKYSVEYETPIQAEAFSDGRDIVERYEGGPGFDIIFLDIEMKYLDGMDAARQIRKKDQDAVIVYITNMAQYAVRGYEVEALDFIVKPVEYDIFVSKMKKAQKTIMARKDQFIIIHNKFEIRKLLMKEIVYVEVRNHSLMYHTIKETYTCSGNLKQAEREIASTAFSRCNSCYLVHMYHVTKVAKDHIVVSNGDVLSISRPRRKQFMKEMTDYFGGR